MKYDIETIQNVMSEYGLIIRAIPNRTRSIYEKLHSDMYPGGKVKMMGKPFNREMWIVESVPEHAGEFIIGFAKHTMFMVSFIKNRYFKSIDDVIDYVLYEYKEEDVIE